MKHFTLIVVATVMACSATAFADGPQPPLHPLSMPAPQYPDEDQKAGHIGKALIRFKVLKDGTVGTAELTKSSGFESLDNAALYAVKQWTFSPPKSSSGDPIEVTAEVPMDFAGSKKSPIPLTKEDMAAFWKKPCSQISSEVSAFRSVHPDKKLRDVETFQATTGLMFLGTYSGSPEQAVKVFKVLPATYELVVKKCGDSPSESYDDVFKEAFKEASSK